ncbi:MAG TPA: DMT family transporter, partial [Anaerolineales bacterium]|nr:DMT family transporter [Anaerolineales bacterium]
AIFLLRERVSWFYWVSAIAGSIVLALLLHPNLHVTALGLLLAFLMGLSFSLYIVMTRMLREESRLTNLFYTGLGVVLPLSFALTAFWKPVTLIVGAMMVSIGLLGFVVLWMLDKALEITDASVLAPFLSTQMIWIFAINVIARII